MKAPYILCLIFISALRLTAGWEPESVSALNEKWMMGEKQAVRSYAEKRLSHNSEDIFALLVSWDYAVSFLDIKSLNKLAPALRQATITTNGVEFTRHKSLLLADIDSVTRLINTISPEILEAEANKGLITGKPMNTLLHLQALERDGYFSASSNIATKPLESPIKSDSKTPTEQAEARGIGPVWWASGLIILASGVLFLVRKRKPKA